MMVSSRFLICLLVVLYQSLKAQSSELNPEIIKYQGYVKSNFQENNNVGDQDEPGKGLDVDIHSEPFRLVLKREETMKDEFYYATVGVGTPGKEFSVIMDTSISFSWLLSKPGYGEVGFDSGKSTSVKLRKSNLLKLNKLCTLKGDLCEDFLDYPGSDARYRFEFLLTHITSCEQFPLSASIQGHVGLKPTWFGSPIKAFAFWFSVNKSTKEEGGELIINGYNKARMTDPNFVFFPLVSKSEWKINIDYVEIDDIAFNCGKAQCTMSFDSSESSFRGPIDKVEEIYNTLEAELDPKTNLWVVDCDEEQWPNLKIFINKRSIDFPGDYFIRKVKNDDDQDYCYVDIKVSEYNNWVAGTAFMTGYYTYFDYLNRRIGIVTAKHEVLKQ